MRQNQFYSNYEKTFNTPLFFHLKANTPMALENAAWLRSISNEESNENEIYNRNPYTNVDRLVSKLLTKSILVECIELKTPLFLEQFDIIIDKKDNSFSIDIQNKSNDNLLLNSNNIDDYFYFLDEKRNRISFEIDKTCLVRVNDVSSFILTPIQDISTGIFNFCWNNIRVICFIK